MTSKFEGAPNAAAEFNKLAASPLTAVHSPSFVFSEDEQAREDHVRRRMAASEDARRTQNAAVNRY